MKQRGQTLVATLIVIVIVALLAVVLLRGSSTFGSSSEKMTRPDGRGGTLPGMVKAQAEDSVCMSNLNQVRMSISMQRTAGDEPPARLEDTKLGDSFLKCPVGGERYQYDSATGNVFCPHLGHEKY